MATIAKKDIVVVGGSLTGLLAAIPLVRLGHNVTILERTPASLLQSQGAGIAPHPIVPPIIALLKGLGVTGSPLIKFFDTYERTGRAWRSYPARRNLRFYRRDGGIKAEVLLSKAVGLTDDETEVASGGTSWDLLYHVLRANFDGWEGSYVEPAPHEEKYGEAKYFDGVKVVGLTDLGEKVEVEVEGGKKYEADFVIGADGPSSFVRRLLEPESERVYAGYVAWRGTVEESELSDETRLALGDHAGIYHAKGFQVIMYRIPGRDGALGENEMLMNIVKYENIPTDQLSTILTDADGKSHNFSLGIGQIDPQVAKAQVESSSYLPPPIYELYSKVPSLFIQAVTDSLASKAVYFNDKLVLVGDAIAGLRPHTTAGTTQGALHALLLTDVFEGKLSLQKWEEDILRFASQVSEIGKQMGNLNQFGKHPMTEDD